MTSKRIIIIFSILLFIVTIVILASTLFNLKTITISYYSNDTVDIDEKQILSAVEKYKGKNLLFLSKSDVAQTVQNSNSYIDDIAVEKIFPTSLILHITKCSELFAVKLTDKEGFEKYYIMDITGKILRTSNEITDNTQLLQHNVLVEGLLNKNVVSKNIGEKLILQDVAQLNCITEVFNTLTILENPFGYNVTEIKDFIKSINVSDMRNVVLQTYAGVKIKFYSGEKNLVNQVRVAVGTYANMNQNDPQKIKGGSINLYESSSDAAGCYAVYSEN